MRYKTILYNVAHECLMTFRTDLARTKWQNCDGGGGGGGVECLHEVRRRLRVTADPKTSHINLRLI